VEVAIIDPNSAEIEEYPVTGIAQNLASSPNLRLSTFQVSDN
jgi:hypothetical protein